MKKLTETEIEEMGVNEAALKALANGEVTDMLGNPMGAEDFTEVDPSWDKGDFVMGTVFPQMRHLQGKVLTIIDATFFEKDRAKYVKDLIKDAFSTQADHITQMLVDSGDVTVAFDCKNGCDGVNTGCSDCPKK